MILNNGKAQTVYLIAGSITGNSFLPQYFMVGSGQTPVTTTDLSLEHPRDRQLVTTATPSITTKNKITFTGDWNTQEISGTNLSEFGVCGSGAGVTGSMWSRSTVPSITFNGNNELRIEESWEVF
jgi:hypothetical protein